ncbi:hypothetical protein BS47DRAFT_1368608 [Hydnum rufescens UP504]|uniref:Uncharacterized protein n=1 Tax=Hydnum rufescens UP504 TaxID=1448309 RepID=A0A9P6DMW7_9AGAM|nr:hypothetical protein BS47DRAFT_1368608 [Hydnum rufescens UP504]
MAPLQTLQRDLVSQVLESSPAIELIAHAPAFLGREFGSSDCSYDPKTELFHMRDDLISQVQTFTAYTETVVSDLLLASQSAPPGTFQFNQGSQILTALGTETYGIEDLTVIFRLVQECLRQAMSIIEHYSSELPGIAASPALMAASLLAAIGAPVPLATALTDVLQAAGSIDMHAAHARPHIQCPSFGGSALGLDTSLLSKQELQARSPLGRSQGFADPAGTPLDGPLILETICLDPTLLRKKLNSLRHSPLMQLSISISQQMTTTGGPQGHATSRSSPASLFKIKYDIKPADLPTWDGQDNTFLQWAEDLDVLAATGPEIAKQLGEARFSDKTPTSFLWHKVRARQVLVPACLNDPNYDSQEVVAIMDKTPCIWSSLLQLENAPNMGVVLQKMQDLEDQLIAHADMDQLNPETIA